jgi:protein SCO1/2
MSEPVPRPQPVQKHSFLPWAILVVLIGGAVIAYNYAIFRADLLKQAHNMPAIRKAPNFRLIDHRGKPFESTALEGQVWVAGFIFTRCPGPCLTVTNKMVELRRSLQDFPELRLVSFSIDPEFDTPEVLTQYAKAHGADTAGWTFLTGKEEPIHQMIAKEFLLPVIEQEGEAAEENGLYIHSTRLVLVDRKGYIRGYYDSDSPEAMTKLTDDIRWLRGQYNE